MSIIYNIEPVAHTIFITAGDSIDISLGVYLNDVAFDMTGYTLNMDVIDKWGETVKTWDSEASGAFTIAATGFNLYDTSGFTTAGNYNADLQMTSGVEIMTIARWNIIVQPQITI